MDTAYLISTSRPAYRVILFAVASFWLTACGSAPAGSNGVVALPTIAQTPVTPAPTVSLTANSLTVTSGGSATVTWSSTGATSCAASGTWSGTKSTSGNQVFSSLTSSSTYTLTCTGNGGSSAPQSVTITVSSSTPSTPTVSLAANPTFVSPNNSSTLTWSATNANSCTASGAWSGSKSTSGNQAVGPLTANSSYILTCTGSGGSANRTVIITVTQPSSGGALSLPSLEDERNTYRKWTWTWTGDKEPGAVKEPISNYSVSGVNIHYGTEGDDLWTYLLMYRRSGNPVYLNRAQAWASYFKNGYRTSDEYGADKGFLLDHMYGWGLVAWYEHTCTTSTCDEAALTEAEKLAADVEAYWSTRSNNTWPVPGKFEMSYYGPRGPARHLLLLTRLAEVTKLQRWIDLREKLLDLWLQSPDWDARGMYFVSAEQTEYVLGAGAYASGMRTQSAFQIGVLTEALTQAYRTTGRPEIKDRLVAMARFIDQYALDAKSLYVCSWFGVKNGEPYSSCAGGSGWDPAYATSLVNTLASGYKYTGDRYFYDRAKYFFNRGTKGKYGTGERTAPDNVVGHFVDTVFASGTENFYLDFNKGELQYTYLLFENGGL